MKRYLKRGVSFIVAASMLSASMPMTALADDGTVTELSEQTENRFLSGAEELSLASLSDGKYTVDLDLNLYDPNAGSSFFTEVYYKNDLMRLSVETDEQGNKNAYLLLPMDFKKAKTFTKTIKIFGYSERKYLTEEITNDDITSQADYNDLKATISADDLSQIDESTSEFAAYFKVPINNLQDELYLYFNYSFSYERYSLKINDISTEPFKKEFQAPVIAPEISNKKNANGRYDQYSILYITPHATVDGTPLANAYIKCSIDEGTGWRDFEGTMNYQGSLPLSTSQLYYDSLAENRKSGISFIYENNEAHELKIKMSLGLQYENDENVYWSNEYEETVNIEKLGMTSLEGDFSKIPDFTENALARVNDSSPIIPYDTTLSLTVFDDADAKDNIEQLLKEETGRSNIDFSVINMNLLTPDGEISEAPIGGTSWIGTSLWTVLPKVKEFDESNTAAYKYENGKLIPLEFVSEFTNEYTRGKGFAFKTDKETGPSGPYVFIQSDYSDLSVLENTWHSLEAVINNPNDRTVVNEYTDIIKNNLVYSYKNDAEKYIYVNLAPINNNYVTEFNYTLDGVDTKAEIIESYNINGEIYPKTVRLQRTSDNPYIPINFVIDNRAISAELGINVRRYTKLTFTPAYSKPEIKVQNANKDTVTKFVNNGVATISINADNNVGDLVYTVTNSNGETLYSNQVYTKPFELNTSNEAGETYTVTAYVKNTETINGALSDSEIVSETITFSAKGQYAITAENPSIGIQYLNGDSLENSKFKVVLSSETDNTDIYYSTVGAEPIISEENKYTEPFTIKGTDENGNATVVKAIAVWNNTGEGINNSEIVQKTVEYSTDWWDNILPNSEYSIPVKMVQYGKTNLLSMGDGAIAGNATLKTDKAGNKTMTIPFKPINMGNIMGKIIHFWYFPDETNYYDEGAWYTYMLDHESIYTRNVDGNIATVTFPIYSKEDFIPVALESSYEAMGRQRTYIAPNYSSIIEDVTGEKQNNKEVDMPEINFVLAADESFIDVSINLSTSSEYKDNSTIYYTLSTGDSFEETDKLEYSKSFKVTRDDVDENGTINVYAVTEDKDGNRSMIASRKIAFDMSVDLKTDAPEIRGEQKESAFEVTLKNTMADTDNTDIYYLISAVKSAFDADTVISTGKKYDGTVNVNKDSEDVKDNTFYVYSAAKKLGYKASDVAEAEFKFTTGSVTEPAAAAQAPAKAEKAADDTIRFVAGIDSLNYKEVGFIFEANGKEVRRSTKTVYSSIADSKLGTADFENAKYLYSFEISDIADLGTDIKVTPYSVDLKGNEVKAESSVYSLNGLSGEVSVFAADDVVSGSAVEVYAEETEEPTAEEENTDVDVDKEEAVIPDTEVVTVEEVLD